MSLFIIYGESQMVQSESGFYLQVTDDGLVWGDSSDASEFYSPQEGRDAAVLCAEKIIERAKALQGESLRELSEFVPEWLAHFVDIKNEFDEDDFRHELYVQELEEELCDSENTRFYVKTDEGWVTQCDNAGSVGYEFCEGFNSACAFNSRAGAWDAVEALEVTNYALIDAQLSFVNIQQKGMGDDKEVLAMSAGLERLILNKAIPEKPSALPKPSKSL